MAKSAIVIGAGIVGLATARALCQRGRKVTLIERNEKATGASIRNFGMIWPIGQPSGDLYEQAMLSKRIWKNVCDEAGIWNEETGSLHLAHSAIEMQVLSELYEQLRTHTRCELLSASDASERSEAIVGANLIGALWSPHEMIVDPREAIQKIPLWLTEKFGVDFIWGRAVTDICYPGVYIGKEELEADEIYVCSGADFETLYPEVYSSLPITKCKLQMMRLVEQPDQWRIGPALCGALSLLHYKGFSQAPTLRELREKMQHEYPNHIRFGIHVMVAQNGKGELTVGDSHEYGLAPDPFDKEFINRLILDYLKTFAWLRDETVIETWHGVYPKLTNGQPHLVIEPEQGVTLINAMGGAGMTLAFGLCDQVVGNKSATHVTK